MCAVHLACQAQQAYLQEFSILLRIVLDILEDLDGHVLAAVGAPEEVTEGARSYPISKGYLRGVELPVISTGVHRRARLVLAKLNLVSLLAG